MTPRVPDDEPQLAVKRANVTSPRVRMFSLLWLALAPWARNQRTPTCAYILDALQCEIIYSPRALIVVVLHRVIVVVVGIALGGIRVDAAPCKGCVLDVPTSTTPVPLVVVLHGDRERATAAAARWHAAVQHRGWALLALQCPADLGCGDSFWKWDGDPSWVRDQVAAVVAAHSIDTRRIYLVGWSGGASYIGWRATAWTGLFAALVIHGGGMAPAEATCVDHGRPVYFLVGDHNPLHRLAKQLRDYFETCKHEVMWDLVPGADHAREDAALTSKKAAAILDWLDARYL